MTGFVFKSIADKLQITILSASVNCQSELNCYLATTYKVGKWHTQSANAIVYWPTDSSHCWSFWTARRRIFLANILNWLSKHSRGEFLLLANRLWLSVQTPVCMHVYMGWLKMRSLLTALILPLILWGTIWRRKVIATFNISTRSLLPRRTLIQTPFSEVRCKFESIQFEQKLEIKCFHVKESFFFFFNLILSPSTHALKSFISMQKSRAGELWSFVLF